MSHTDVWAKSVPNRRILSSEALRLEHFSILRVLIYTHIFSTDSAKPVTWMWSLQCSHSRNSPSLCQSKSLFNPLLPFDPYSLSVHALLISPLASASQPFLDVKNVTCQFPAQMSPVVSHFILPPGVNKILLPLVQFHLLPFLPY